jgi:hypothetical protein
MEENQKKLAETLEMFKPLLEGNNLSTEMSDYLETLYYVPREKMSFYNGITNNSNLFDKTKLFPVSADNSEGYFVAEFWFPYLVGGIFKSNYFMISHVFKLDIQQIEAELNKLSNAEKSIFKTIVDPKNIAFVIQERYKKFIPYLSGENGKEDYEKITELLYNYYLPTTIGTKQYGI